MEPASEQLVHPLRPDLMKERDRLLQEALRPEPALPFGIAAEYPLVLSAQATHHSYGLCLGDELIAHANLWPRSLAGTPVGLIGNVATAKTHRHRGVARRLLAHLETQALALGLDALILWSDLHQFYQNLGFAPRGRELRLYLPPALAPAADWRRVDPSKLSDEELMALMRLRPGVPTLARSVAEFRAQLGIPATDLYLGQAAAHLLGYVVVGRGFDLQGVVHEWGAVDASCIVFAAQDIAAREGWSEIIVLAPPAQCQALQTDATRVTARIEEHPMALVKALNDKSAAVIDRAFIWGLDSI